MPKTAAQWLKTLPPYIDYVGFRFRLGFVDNAVGYFLSELRCKTAYKKKAFEYGFWTEKRIRYHLESVESNFLFKTEIWSDDNDDLTEALERLYKHLLQYRIVQPTITEWFVGYTEFSEVAPYALTINNF